MNKVTGYQCPSRGSVQQPPQGTLEVPHKTQPRSELLPNMKQKFRGFQIWICHLPLTTCSVGSYPTPFLHATGHRLFFSVSPRGHKFGLFWTKVCCSTLDQSQERCPGHPSLPQRNTQELQPALNGR